MIEPSPLMTSMLIAFGQAPTTEGGLAAAVEVLVNKVVPPCRTPPDDYDLEEWGRYSKQASIRRRIAALVDELRRFQPPPS
jgi:hypothetical protein